MLPYHFTKKSNTRPVIFLVVNWNALEFPGYCRHPLSANYDDMQRKIDLCRIQLKYFQMVERELSFIRGNWIEEDTSMHKLENYVNLSFITHRDSCSGVERVPCLLPLFFKWWPKRRSKPLCHSCRENFVPGGPTITRRNCTTEDQQGEVCDRDSSPVIDYWMYVETSLISTLKSIVLYRRVKSKLLWFSLYSFAWPGR